MRLAVSFSTLVVAALAPPVAAAEEAPSPGVSTTYDYQPAPRAVGLVLRPTTGWDLDLFTGVEGVAGAGEGGNAGSVLVGGRLRLPGVAPACRLLDVGGVVRLDADAAAQVTLGVCLFHAHAMGHSAPGLALRHEGAFEARPELAAPRTRLRRRFTSGSLTIEGSVVEGMARVNSAALLPYRFVIDATEQEARVQRRWSIAIDGVRFLRPEAIVFGDPDRPDGVISVPARELTVLGVFHADAWEGDVHVKAGGLSFFRVLGLRAPRGVVVDAELTLAVGDVWTYDDAGAPDAQRASALTPAGFVAAAGAWRWLTWRAGLARELQPSFDGALVLEDRVEGALTLGRGRGVRGLSLSAFAAHSIVYEAYETTGDWTGGAALSRSFRLGRGLSLVASAEVARSWYATLDGDARPRPAPAARGWVTLAWSR